RLPAIEADRVDTRQAIVPREGRSVAVPTGNPEVIGHGHTGGFPFGDLVAQLRKPRGLIQPFELPAKLAVAPDKLLWAGAAWLSGVLPGRKPLWVPLAERWKKLNENGQALCVRELLGELLVALVPQHRCCLVLPWDTVGAWAVPSIKSEERAHGPGHDLARARVQVSCALGLLAQPRQRAPALDECRNSAQNLYFVHD